MNKRFIVYCYKSPSNKKYIGITCTSKKERAGKDGSYYKPCKAFYNAIQKYGYDNFQYQILEADLTQEEAFEKEKYYINLYDTQNPEKGYNISPGGSAPMLGRHHTEETKKKLSELNSGENCYWYGKHLSEETKQKIAEKNHINFSGENNPMYGKHVSEETKEKIRKTFTERKVSQGKNNPMYGRTGALNPNSVKIYCIKDGEKVYFDGIREAGRLLNIPSPNIIRALNSNGRLSAGKDSQGKKIYWFRVKEEENNENK